MLTATTRSTWAWTSRVPALAPTARVLDRPGFTGWIPLLLFLVLVLALTTEAAPHPTPGLFHGPLPVDSTGVIDVAHPYLDPATVTVIPTPGDTLSSAAWLFDPDRTALQLTPNPQRGWPPFPDSLTVTYRYLPVDPPPPAQRMEPLPMPVVDSLLAGQDPVSLPERSPFAQATRGFGSQLRRSGHITRGVQVGSGRDVSLESGLRLSLEGRLARDISVKALLDDRNLPLAPEGTSRRLDEIDQVYVDIEAGRAGGRFGDYRLQTDAGRYGRLDRRLEGGRLRYDGPDLSASAAGAVTRAVFHTNQFSGVDGVQGPYRLTGRDGEQDFLVVGGSETVWVDGIQRQRGAAADYTIDYSRGEITFTSRLPIDSESRIEVDFEYSPEAFPRNLYAGDVAWRDPEGRFRVAAMVTQEGDDPDRPLGFEMTGGIRDQLAAAGDAPGQVLVPTAEEVEPGEGDYVPADTVWTDGMAYSIYRFVEPGPDGEPRGSWRVPFSEVGTGQGDYSREYDPLYGLYRYEWVGPGNGDWVARRALPLPERRRHAALSFVAGEHENLTLHADLGLSDVDRNVLSGIGDGDNTALATDIRLTSTPLGRQGTLFGSRNSSISRQQHSPRASVRGRGRAGLARDPRPRTSVRGQEGMGESTLRLKPEAGMTAGSSTAGHPGLKPEGRLTSVGSGTPAGLKPEGRLTSVGSGTPAGLKPEGIGMGGAGPSGTTTPLTLTARYRSRPGNYTALSRDREVEFNRRYGLDSTATRADEQEAELRLASAPLPGLTVSGGSGYLQRAAKEVLRGDVGVDLRRQRVDASAFAERIQDQPPDVTPDDGSVLQHGKDDWTRARGSLTLRPWGPLAPGVDGEWEDRDAYSRDTTFTGFQLARLRYRLAVADWAGHGGSLYLQQRSRDRQAGFDAYEGVYDETGVGALWTWRAGTWAHRVELSRAEKRYAIADSSDITTDLAALTAGYSPLNGALRADLDYQLSQTVTRANALIAYTVPAGQGDYIRVNDEYVYDPEVGDIILRPEPSGEALPTTDLATALSLDWSPRRLPGGAGKRAGFGWEDISLVSQIEVREVTSWDNASAVALLNPGALQTDSTVEGQLTWRQDVHLFRGETAGNLRIRYLADQRLSNLYLTGAERSVRDQWSALGRVAISEAFDSESELRYERLVKDVVRRGRTERFRLLRARHELGWRIDETWRVTLDVGGLLDRSLADGEDVTGLSLTPGVIVAVRDRGRISAEFEALWVESALASLPYELANGRPRGRNGRGNLRADYRLGDHLTSRAIYTVRLDQGRDPIHVARVEVSAFF